MHRRVLRLWLLALVTAISTAGCQKYLEPPPDAEPIHDGQPPSDAPTPDAYQLCGNDSIDPGEACDGGDLGGRGCVDLGYDSGDLACRPDCTFDTSGCVGAPHDAAPPADHSRPRDAGVGDSADGAGTDGVGTDGTGTDGTGTDGAGTDGAGTDGTGTDGTGTDGTGTDGTGTDGAGIDGVPRDATSEGPRPPDQGPTALLVYVDARNAGIEDGSMLAPYRTLTAAINGTAGGGAIRVAEGNYKERVTIKGKVLQLLGGYPGGSAADYASGAGGDFANADPLAHVTTITGTGGGATLTLQQAGASLVRGFTITGLNRGVVCTGGKPTLRDNRVTGNKAPTAFGGGIYASNCGLTLLDNVIEQNVGSRGGGVSTLNGTLLFQRNVFRNNTAQSDHGGGIYLVTGTVQLHDNRFEGNVVGPTLGFGWGGGMALINCKATLSGNVATGNHAPTFGGAAFVDDGSVATLDNELYYANLCGSGAAGLYVDGLNATTRSTATLTNVTIANHPCTGTTGNAVLVERSDVTIRNAIFWNNAGSAVVKASGSTLAVSYTNNAQTLAGTGNLKLNPLFAGSAASGDHAFRLSSVTGRWDGAAWVQDAQSSPCIDAGDPGLGVGTEPAPNGGRANMGAFGRAATASQSP